MKSQLLRAGVLLSFAAVYSLPSWAQQPALPTPGTPAQAAPATPEQMPPAGQTPVGQPPAPQMPNGQGAAGAVGQPAATTPSNQPMPMPMDPVAGDALPTADFVTAATAANVFEVESSRVVVDRTQHEGIRAFAQQMLQEHALASQFLAMVAQNAEVMEGELPDELPEDKQQFIDDLAAVEDAGIDHAYIDLQIAAHQEAIGIFTAYAMGGEDETLRTFASMMLPGLHHHLAMAEELQRSLSATPTGGTAPTGGNMPAGGAPAGGNAPGAGAPGGAETPAGGGGNAPAGGGNNPAGAGNAPAAGGNPPAGGAQPAPAPAR